MGVSERLVRVGSVISLMQEAAIRQLDTATGSNPPHCCRRTQPTPMSAKADKPKITSHSSEIASHQIGAPRISEI